MIEYGQPADEIFVVPDWAGAGASSYVLCNDGRWARFACVHQDYRPKKQMISETEIAILVARCHAARQVEVDWILLQHL
jgi:hypothetical protein